MKARIEALLDAKDMENTRPVLLVRHRSPRLQQVWACGDNPVVAENATPRVGRPSVGVDRQRQIVGAFIDLVAERGLERVTVDDVAKASGVQRAAVHHYVGNREELIVAAVDELARRYEVSVVEMSAGDEPTIDELIALLFSDELTRHEPVESAAFEALLAEAVRRPAARDGVIKCYDMQLGHLAAAMRRAFPKAPVARVRDTAYLVLCLVEKNTTLQQLGYPRTRQLGARDAARCLVDELAAEFGVQVQS